jgi:hypothetical protein
MSPPVEILALSMTLTSSVCISSNLHELMYRQHHVGIFETDG